MADKRKPIPKSQREILNNQIDPYVNPETGETLDNPNIPSSFNQFTSTNQTGVDFNRSEKLSFKEDTTKPFSVGLLDIDESIIYYIEQVVKPFVIQNGERIPVPLVYGSPERWKSSQKDGYYRDKKGKIMAPLMIFKRSDVEKLRNLTNKLDANNPKLYTSWQKHYSKKNFYSNFNVLTNSIPVKQFHANVVPDYVKIIYNFTIQTYYVSQLNKIIEAFNYASDSYWGNPERFRFKATIDKFNTITELNDNTNRIVKSEFSVTLFGYIVPDVLQKDTEAIKKYNSKAKVTINTETVTSIEDTPQVISTTTSLPCSPVSIFDSSGNLLLQVPSGGSYTISSGSNAIITVNNQAYGSAPSNTTFNVDVEYEDGTDVGTVSSSIVEIPDNRYNSANPYKTGQTTSYASNDDGDLQRGRGTSFTDLGFNNPFGNTNRFTDTTGAQTYANDWVIDWGYADYVGKIVQGYYRIVSIVTNTWTGAMASQPATIGSYSDCYIINTMMAISLSNYGAVDNCLNYVPFNTIGATTLWLSTTYPANTANGMNFITGQYRINNAPKTNGARVMYFREFTFTELGL